jgi:hypothetical protein
MVWLVWLISARIAHRGFDVILVAPLEEVRVEFVDDGDLIGEPVRRALRDDTVCRCGGLDSMLAFGERCLDGVCQNVMMEVYERRTPYSWDSSEDLRVPC